MLVLQNIRECWFCIKCIEDFYHEIMLEYHTNIIYQQQCDLVIQSYTISKKTYARKTKRTKSF